MNDSRETIFALSSGAGRAGVAVLRISGPGCRLAVEAMAAPLPAARKASLRRIIDPDTRQVIDSGLVIWLPGPCSFTGEDMAEFQVHGSIAVIQKLVHVFQGFTGFRSAEAGEFAKRAFLNNKLDLAEVEGLADLIDAETEMQRRQAVRLVSGEMSRLLDSWRQSIMRSLAFLEAVLDFPEDDDIGEKDIIGQVAREIAVVSGEIADFLKNNNGGERLREGVRVVIAGAPNSGKSTLLNALSKRDVAIVSDIAGTTRDILEVHLDLGGYPVTLVDTAGLREPEEIIEMEGIRRANREISSADIVIAMRDAVCGAKDEKLPIAFDSDAKSTCIPVVSKWDLNSTCEAKNSSDNISDEICISVHKGWGMQVLLDRIEGLATRLCGSGQQLITRARHRESLQHCLSGLQKFSIQGGFTIGNWR